MDQQPLWEEFRAAVAALRAETISVGCSETSHRMRLSDHGLEPIDHDLTSEEALSALGGNLPTCIQLSRA